MFQARKVSSMQRTINGDIEIDSDDWYSEPGYDVMSPIELEFPVSDRVVVGLRKRLDSGYVWTPYSDVTVTCTDPTNGQGVPFSLSNYYDQVYITITNSLDLNALVTRVRVIDVHVVDSTDNMSFDFRILIDDEDKNFHYISVDSNNIGGRTKSTAQGRDIYVSTKAGSDHYVLFSPYAYLRETTEQNSDFSYPLNTIFYKRQNAYNNEDYSYSISDYSHSFMRNVVSVMNVPSYGKAAVLLIDNKIYKDIKENNVNPYVDIAVNGYLSEISDTFRVNFTA